MDKNLVELSKVISYALRHEPWVFELELDEHGWVSVETLIFAIKSYNTSFIDISIEEIQKIIDESAKKRFEMKDGNIRAIYGHSLPGKIQKNQLSRLNFYIMEQQMKLLNS